MKFDFIIGNPPYQDDRIGESTTALPIYDKFIDAVYDLADVDELITPARFLFNSGRTPKDWNEKVLTNGYLKVLFYENDASKIFPWTDIKGGIAITYHDKRRKFKPIKTFSRYPEIIPIIDKIFGKDNVLDLSEIAFVASKFNTETLFKDYPEPLGRERRMASNVLKYDFLLKKKSDDDIMIYGIHNNKRVRRYINKKYVNMSDAHIQQYKIIIPKADGNGIFGDTLTNPEILPPQSGFTHFWGLGGFDRNKDAEAALKYLKTKFARSLLGVLKVTQDLNADKLKYVPLQDFTPNSDIDWSKSIPEIDRQLYAKYGLDEQEIEFIETHVKGMECWQEAASTLSISLAPTWL